MIGALLNAIAIVLGALLGLVWRGALTVRTEVFFKSALAAFTAFFGLRLVWVSLEGTMMTEVRQVLVILVAAVLGIADGPGHEAALLARIGETLALHRRALPQPELAAALMRCEDEARRQLHALPAEPFQTP